MASQFKGASEVLCKDDETWCILTWWKNSWRVEKVDVFAKEFEHISQRLFTFIRRIAQIVIFFREITSVKEARFLGWFHEFFKKRKKKRKYEWRTGAKEVIRFSAPADKKKEKNVWVIFKRICRWHIEEQTCLSIPGKSTSVWGFFFYQLSGHRGYSFGFRGPMKVIFWVKTQKTIQKFCDRIFTKHNLLSRLRSKIQV